MKVQHYLVAAIAGILLLAWGIQAFYDHMEERAKAQQARNFAEKKAIALARRASEWNSRKTEITADIDRALKENRPKDARALLNQYREVAGSELSRYEQQLQVALEVERLNDIPQSNVVAREGSLGTLARLDPDNPRWKRELLALQRAVEAQRRKDDEYRQREQLAREREELARRRRREGVSIGMTQERVLPIQLG